MVHMRVSEGDGVTSLQAPQGLTHLDQGRHHADLAWQLQVLQRTGKKHFG